MPEAFDAAVANPGDGGAAFAGDSFMDAGTQARFMPFTVLCLPDGAGYSRITSSAGLPVAPQSGATFPISAALLPLPADAARESKQPALGTAGNPASDVLTVQGRANMTALKVDGSAVTQPVSGTIVANAGAGNFNVVGSVTATPGDTFPISADTLPLPTGAATSARQAAPGTAGSPSAEVVSIQGVASGTAVQVDGSGVTQPVSGTIVANAGSGTFNVGGTVVANPGGTFPISADSLPLPLGAATAARQALPGTAGSPSPEVLSIQGISGGLAIRTDGSAFTQPISGTVVANAGTGTFAVSAASLPLPAGAATEAMQPAFSTAGAPVNDCLTVQGHSGMYPLAVDGSGVTQPVSVANTVNVEANSLPLPAGAATAARQAAPGTAGSASAEVVSIQGIASMVPVQVGGTVVANAGTGTFAVSAASLPLPAGASTEAKQPQFAPAGTPSNDCLSVQGRSGMYPLAVDGSGVTQPVSIAGTVNVAAASLPLPGGAAVASKQATPGTAGTPSSEIYSVQGAPAMTPVQVAGTITANVGSGTMPITAAALPLPLGAATEAKQPAFGSAGSPSNDCLSVQGRAGMTPITVQENGAAITSLQLIDDVVFAEDAASANGDKGVQILAKRGDTPAATSGTDGDYEPLQVSGGLLWTRARGMQDSGGTDITDTSAHALKVSVVAGSTSGTQYTEDAASESDPVGTAIIAVRDDLRAGNVTSTDGDNIALRGTNFGELYVKHVDTLPITAASLPLPSGAATSAKQPGFGSAGSPIANVLSIQGINSMVPVLVTLSDATIKAEDSSSADGDKGVPAMAVRKDAPANTSNADGDYEMLQVSSGRLWTSAVIDAALPAGSNVIGAVHARTQDGAGNAVTSAVRGAERALSVQVVDASGNQVTSFGGSTTNLTQLGGNAVSTGNGGSGNGVLRVAQVSDGTGVLGAVTTLTGSGVPNGSTDSGNPHKIGGKAQTTSAAVSDGQRVDARFDKLGRINTRPGQVRELVTDGGTITVSDTTETTVLPAGAGGVFHDLTLVLVNNTSGTDVRVDFRDATGGSVRFPILAKAGQLTGFAPPRPVKQSAAANNWTAQLSASVSDVRIFVQADKEI